MPPIFDTTSAPNFLISTSFCRVEPVFVSICQSCSVFDGIHFAFMKVPHALVDMEIIMGIARYDVSRHVLSKIPNALGFVHRGDC